MTLYLICSMLESEIELDSFIWACSIPDAVEYWKQQYPLAWEHGDELTVITVPTNHGILGAVPMEMVSNEDVVL